MRWKLWLGIGVLGVVVVGLGFKLIQVIGANQSLANDNNQQRQLKENAIQQADVERQQKNAAIQKSNELQTKVAQLTTEVKQLRPTT